MNHKKILILTGILLFIVVGAGGYYGPEWYRLHQDRQSREDFVPPGVPKRVVDNFRGQFNSISIAMEPKTLPDVPFVDINGKTRKFSDFKGKPTLVNFWATWCAPCVVELPSIQKFAKHYEGKLQVVGISLEQNRTPAEIKGFLEQRTLGDFAGYVDQDGALTKALELSGIPTSFLIGSDGLILYRFEGDADWTSADSREFFDIFLLQNR